jgi:predicted RNA-binding Zn ribbon-like protein
MVVAVDAMSLPVLVELVNGWAGVARRADGRDGAAYPRIADLADQLGVPPSVGVALTDRELAATADRLHPVFAASDAASTARLVTECLDETGIRPSLRARDAELRRGWSVPDERGAVLGASAVALREFLVGHGADRLGVCTGQRCADVYVDASPGGRRRFCSVTCQNRTRLAAFRGRRAAASRPGSEARDRAGG